jgi:trk system potassium uptake protein TrkH
MDVIAENSLCDYVTNPIINAVTSLLIILGGLGFIVWWDVLRVIKSYKTAKLGCFKKLTLHTKIVLSSTAVLLFGGAILIFIFEYNNPLTIGELSIFDKIQASFFQSVTTRTAGFFTLPQENLTNASSIVCLLLMFIGGSPVGTAGGVKTVTFAVLLGAAFASIRNRQDVNFFHRRVSSRAVSKALAVVAMSSMILFVSTVLLAAVTDASAMDLLYETVSATATVGLSRNLTSTLGVAGKWILITTMYLGRVGPISLAVAFRVRKKDPNVVRDPEEEISVG